MIVCQKNPENVLDFLGCGVRDLARDLQRLQRQTASAGFTEYISSGEIQVKKRMPQGVPKSDVSDKSLTNVAAIKMSLQDHPRDLISELRDSA